MKFLVDFMLAVCLLNGSLAQRSPYASMGTGLRLLPRFQSPDDGLANRDNVETSTVTTTSTELPKELQGTLEDDVTVQRVALWPEHRQPFWYKNRHVMNAQRVRPVDGVNFQPGSGAGADAPWFFSPNRLNRDNSNQESTRKQSPSNAPSNWNWRDVRPSNSGLRIDLHSE